MRSSEWGQGAAVHELPWINPIGGFGDALMLSGILKQKYDQNRANCFNLVRRTRYTSMFRDHPAIATIGHPPRGARIIAVDYWSDADFGPGPGRAYQALARRFGLPMPAPEVLYLADSRSPEGGLPNFLLPADRPRVVVAPNSESPRKSMSQAIWEEIVVLLGEAGFDVCQVGQREDRHIRGAYSLCGTTNLQDLLGVLGACTAILTVDSFVMHLARLTATPTVVLWGPTDAEVYGYQGQIHLTGCGQLCSLKSRCLGPGLAENYGTDCPIRDRHCMHAIDPVSVVEALRDGLRRLERP